MSNQAHDVNERDPNLIAVMAELEGDAATIGYIHTRVTTIRDLLKKAPVVEANVNLARLETEHLLVKLEARRLALVGELTRLRVAED